MANVDITGMNEGVNTENVNDAMASLLNQGGFGIEGYQPQATTPPEPTEPAAATTEPTAAEDDPEVTTEPEPDPEPVQSPVEVLTLPDGRVLTLEDAERFAEFESTILRDPRFQTAYDQAFGTAAPAATPTLPPTTEAPAVPAPPALPPEFADELADNPIVKVLWDRIQEQELASQKLQQEQARIMESTQAQRDAIDNYERNNAATLVNQARFNYQREHKLTQKEMDRVFDTTVNMFDLNKIVSLPFDPRTGEMETPDPVRRLEMVFDSAYKAIPEFFEREQTLRVTAAKADAERKSKLTSLSSSGSSAPPPTPVDNTDPAARRSAFLADTAAALSGNFIQPE